MRARCRRHTASHYTPTTFFPNGKVPRVTFLVAHARKLCYTEKNAGGEPHGKGKTAGDIINHSEAADYVAPTDPLLLSRLEWFQDQKLALMVHWGGYSQWGICESWPLSDADASWSRRDVDWESDPACFRRQYSR